jgi:2-C-methyl-D-erythritol 4-phosphate cytidylyltransferase
MRMVAVVLGGGVGQRLGAGMPKQLLTLGGQTLVERCVAAFDQAPGVDEILVVMAPGYTDQVKAMLAAGGYRKVTDVIEGGATRPDSTRVALAAIASPGEGGSWDQAGGDCGVLLHDAARPLVDQRIIADCVASLEVHEAAGVAVPTSDTIVITDNGVMRSVPRRETLFRCQTPQCFRLRSHGRLRGRPPLPAGGRRARRPGQRTEYQDHLRAGSGRGRGAADRGAADRG